MKQQQLSLSVKFNQLECVIRAGKHHSTQTSLQITVSVSSYLKHNRIDASKFSFFSVEILNGTLQQKNFGVFNRRIHLKNK